jgi:CHASE2 domain-containing sensor protein
LSNWQGLLLPENPMRPWVFAALVIIFILTIQGMGILLPNNLRIYRELQQPEPNIERIVRINRTNLTLSGVQGVFQVLIIFVMAYLATH